MGELSKRHDEVLIEAAELFDIAFASIPRDTSAKGMQRQMVHEL